MSIKNVFFPSAADIAPTGYATADLGHSRLDKADVVMFIGSTGAQRLANFVKNYVVDTTFTNPNGNNTGKELPTSYTINERGLPNAAIWNLYFTDGVWYLFFQNINPYDADINPFNKKPNPDGFGHSN